MSGHDDHHVQSPGREWITVDPERFQAARWLGVILISFQAAILGFLSGARLFPLAVIAAAFAVGGMRYRLRLDRLVLQLLCLSIAIGLVLYDMAAPATDESLFPGTSWAPTVARFLLCMQVLALAIRHQSGHPPIWLAGLGTICLPFAANVQIPDHLHGRLTFWIMGFVAAGTLYSALARRKIETSSRSARIMRTALMLSALIIAIVSGGGSALAVFKYERDIEHYLRGLLGDLAGQARLGFSPSGRLTDVLVTKTMDSERVALRVFADHKPGYLRGKALDTYESPRWEHAWRAWSSGRSTHPLPRADAVHGLPEVSPGNAIFAVNTAATGPWNILEVWPEQQMGQYLFAPVDAGYVAINSATVNSASVTSDVHGSLVSEHRDELLPYSVFIPQTPPPSNVEDDLRPVLTALGNDIDPFIHELAESLFADCRTPREKMNRVQSWFRNHFTYRLGIRIPRGVDPLTYFLQEHEPAHCEFFATGTAVLLRLAGVPCRYVTGYVAAEKNAVGGYWIARNKDAHAWVEAYDDETREWVIVESTPADGIPQQRDIGTSSQLADSIKQRWAMLVASIRATSIGELTRRAARLFWSIPGLLALLLIVGGLLLWKSPPLPAFSFRRSDHRLRDLHAVLKQLDRMAKRRGLKRNSDETLLQFADRIRRSETDPQWRHELAGHYDQYACMRFRSPSESASLDALRDAFGLS